MATIITHALLGSSLSLFRPAQVSRIRLTLVLALLPVIPDLDVIAFTFGIPYAHPLGHRGFTHSILFAFILAVTLPRLLFRRVPLGTKSWIVLVILFFLSTISHGILDAMTDAGLGVGFFIPMDNGRYFFPWRPIATSPLGISAFFNGDAKGILLNEFTWIGIPALIGVSLILVVKFFKKRTKTHRSF